jgi:hypothetical protein
LSLSIRLSFQNDLDIDLFTSGIIHQDIQILKRSSCLNAYLPINEDIEFDDSATIERRATLRSKTIVESALGMFGHHTSPTSPVGKGKGPGAVEAGVDDSFRTAPVPASVPVSAPVSATATAAPGEEVPTVAVVVEAASRQGTATNA